MASLITFQDHSGAISVVSLKFIAEAALASLAATLASYSNAVVTEIQPEIPVTPGTPTAAAFDLVCDKAVIRFSNAADDIITLTIPSPKAALFELDTHGNRVLIASIGNALAATLGAAMGQTLTFLSGDYVSRPDFRMHWADIADIPSVFPPAEHTHEYASLQNLPTASADWAAITNKPATFPPSAHGHNFFACARYAGTGTAGRVIAFTPLITPAAILLFRNDRELVAYWNATLGNYLGTDSTLVSAAIMVANGSFTLLKINGNDIGRNFTAFIWGA